MTRGHTVNPDKQVFRLRACLPFAFPPLPLQERQWRIERDVDGSMTTRRPSRRRVRSGISGPLLVPDHHISLFTPRRSNRISARAPVVLAALYRDGGKSQGVVESQMAALDG